MVRKAHGRIPPGTASPRTRGKKANETNEIPVAAISVGIPARLTIAVQMEYTGGNVVIGAGIVP
jgi:hypothetical protein